MTILLLSLPTDSILTFLMLEDRSWCIGSKCREETLQGQERSHRNAPIWLNDNIVRLIRYRRSIDHRQKVYVLGTQNPPRPWEVHSFSATGRIVQIFLRRSPASTPCWGCLRLGCMGFWSIQLLHCMHALLILHGPPARKGKLHGRKRKYYGKQVVLEGKFISLEGDCRK